MVARGTFIVPVHDLDVDGRDVTFPITQRGSRGARGVRNAARWARGPHRCALHEERQRCAGPGPGRRRAGHSLCSLPQNGRASSQHRDGALAPSHNPANPPKRPKRGAERAGAEEPEGEFAPTRPISTATKGTKSFSIGSFARPFCSNPPSFPCARRPVKVSVRPRIPASLTGQAVTNPRLLPLLELAKRRNLKE